MVLPLEGVRVVSMEQLIAIPGATKLLADMGAEIIRVESCVRLENYRNSSFYENTVEGEYWNRGANFYEQNRNKLGLTLDLTKPAGLKVLTELISVSDVFTENFTPRVMRNFGLEYEDLRKLRPDIIMVSSTGYGYEGPWSEYGAIAYATEAASGLSHISGYESGPPVLPELPYADYTAAEHTVFAIMAALMFRARTGKGQFIDVSQTETLTSTIPEAIMDYTVNGRIRQRTGNHHPYMAPHGCYPCTGDDKWIALAVRTDVQWKSLCQVLDEPEWCNETRFADAMSRWERRQDLDRLISKETCRWEQYELMHALQARGVPAGAVLKSKQLLSDPHLKSRQFFEPVAHHPSTDMPSIPYATRGWKMSETSLHVRYAAPLLGQHNRFILGEMVGISETDLEDLEADGVIGHRPVGARPPTVISLEDQKRQGRIFDYEEDFKQKLRTWYGP